MTDRTITEKETMKKTGAKTKVKANAGIRLNRFIAMHTGVSRRNADDIIKEERVLINGKKIKNLATAVKEGDEVAVDGKKIKYKEEPKIYIMLNKPQGYITAVKSEIYSSTSSERACSFGTRRRIYFRFYGGNIPLRLVKHNINFRLFFIFNLFAVNGNLVSFLNGGGKIFNFFTVYEDSFLFYYIVGVSPRNACMHSDKPI